MALQRHWEADMPDGDDSVDGSRTDTDAAEKTQKQMWF